MSTISKKALGVNISLKANKDSSISDLFSISDERRVKLEEVVNCEDAIQRIASMPKVELLEDIMEECQDITEFGYCMYILGSLNQQYTTHDEKEVGDVDTIDLLANT